MMKFAIHLAAAVAVSISLAACGSSSPPPAQPSSPGGSAAWGPPGSPTSPPPAGRDQYGDQNGDEYGDQNGEQSGAPVNEDAYPEDEPAPRPRPAERPEQRPAPAPARGDDEPAAGEPPARADSMSELERTVAAEINRMRRNPKAWVAALQRYRGYYDGRFLRLPGSEIPIQTFEGVAAVDEAIAAARASKPLPEMRVSPGLTRAAREHAKEIGAAGSIEHIGKNGSTPFDRMKRQGRLDGMAGENIGTAIHGAGELVVIDLFVDDGIDSRGHRKNLLSHRYNVVGVGCAPHKAYGTICVLDFAEGFEDR
ncbi:MAG TPA: CAP domain-containing protein [Haliangium sp.]|nr:CAP domain-containing protein [Haliangium sp.]